MKRKNDQDRGGEKKAKGGAIQTTLMPLLVKWRRESGSSILAGEYGEQASSVDKEAKIAAFDFDGTIACWKDRNSNQSQPKSASDWSWFHDSVPKVLVALARLDYRIVFLSNQKNILNGDKRNLNRLAYFKGRVEMTIKGLKKYCFLNEITPVPHIQILAATLDDIYRKPTCGMWHHFSDSFTSSSDSSGSVRPKLCFYVGDAAGRLTDHADTDYKFALNLNVPFYTPEQVFNDNVLALYSSGSVVEIQFEPETPLPTPAFNPTLFLKTFQSSEAVCSSQEKVDYSSFDVVILIGSPASGKSTWARQNLSSHQIVSQDECKTSQKCYKQYEELVTSGVKVVLDNTNPSEDSRYQYLQFAKSQSKKVIGIIFTTSSELAKHNNVYRCLVHEMLRFQQFNQVELDFLPKHIPQVALNMFQSKFKEPSIEEGFDEIVRLDFEPVFKSDSHRNLWTQFYF